jgi:hypothetical protein
LPSPGVHPLHQKRNSKTSFEGKVVGAIALSTPKNLQENWLNDKIAEEIALGTLGSVEGI